MKQYESKIIFKKISINLSKDTFFKIQTVVFSNKKKTRTLFLNVLEILFKKLFDQKQDNKLMYFSSGRKNTAAFIQNNSKTYV